VWTNKLACQLCSLTGCDTMGVPGVTCSAKRKSNRWLVGAAVLVLLLATAHAEEAAAGVADADVKADADADAGATPDTVELLPPEQPQLKQDKRAEERFNATDAAGALEGDGDGEAGDVEGVAPEASTPPTVLVESGDGEEATDTSAPTGKAETATASSVPAPTGEDAGGGAGGDARQTMDDTTGDAGDGLQDGEEEGGEEGDEQGDGEEDQYGEEEGYGEGVGDVGGEGMEDEDEGEAGDGDGNLDGRGAEVDEDADEYEPPQTRRDMGYNPNRWRGAPSTHPDEVFRASYQPSHILTFRVKAGHAETFFADVEAGAVVRGDFFVAKGGAYSLDVKVRGVVVGVVRYLRSALSSCKAWCFVFQISSPSGTKLFVKHGALSGIFMFTAKCVGCMLPCIPSASLSRCLPDVDNTGFRFVLLCWWQGDRCVHCGDPKYRAYLLAEAGFVCMAGWS